MILVAARVHPGFLLAAGISARYSGTDQLAFEIIKQPAIVIIYSPGYPLAPYPDISQSSSTLLDSVSVVCEILSFAVGNNQGLR